MTWWILWKVCEDNPLFNSSFIFLCVRINATAPLSRCFQSTYRRKQQTHLLCSWQAANAFRYATKLQKMRHLTSQVWKVHNFLSLLCGFVCIWTRLIYVALYPAKRNTQKAKKKKTFTHITSFILAKDILCRKKDYWLLRVKKDLKCTFTLL